jgi:cyanamide hydratase
MQQQFPEHDKRMSPSTLALTSLLHDIGTAEENLSATHMSFEFYGGIKALNLLQDSGCAKDQAEAVCETIIRHQDLGTDGNITFLGQVIQLATIYDNVSDHPHVENIKDIIHDTTRDDVIRSFPRDGWLACFAKTVQQEVQLKPWSHTTHIPEFNKKILGNQLMRKYE